MRRNEKGFTLIEIIVVIIMIGILATIAVPIYSGYVYRARTSEGVVTLGAVKTFLLEQRNSRGFWPEKTDIMNQFDNFKALYYFSKVNADIIVSYGTDKNGPRIAVRLNPSDKFDIPSNVQNGWIQINIDWENNDNYSGWSGGIATEYAHHLPPCTEPL